LPANLNSTGAGSHEIVNRYDPVNLFEMVPKKLKVQMEPELAGLEIGSWTM
jgi:hypothetical protein